MAFGSFSTPSVNTKNIAGYSTPQALFADVPSAGPGGVTSNVVASMPIQGMDIQDQIAAYNFAKLQKEDRKREWAEAAAKNRARMGDRRPAYQKGWNVINPEEEKLKAAFAEVYAPQLRRTFHDQAMSALGSEGDKLRQRFGHVGQYPGGYSSSSGNVGPNAQRRPNAFGSNQIPLQGQDQERLNRTLAQMWRMETDPYLKAVGGGMKASAVMSAMQPGQIPRGMFGGGGAKSRGRVGSKSSGFAQTSMLPEYEEAGAPLHAPVRGKAPQYRT